MSYRGAQGRYGGDPDLTAFGKIIGGGFPIGATGGRAEVMEVFDPGTRGPRIASGGTFSANPVSMTAGLATMRAMTAGGVRSPGRARRPAPRPAG